MAPVRSRKQIRVIRRRHATRRLSAAGHFWIHFIRQMPSVQHFFRVQEIRVQDRTVQEIRVWTCGLICLAIQIWIQNRSAAMTADWIDVCRYSTRTTKPAEKNQTWRGIRIGDVRVVFCVCRIDQIQRVIQVVICLREDSVLRCRKHQTSASLVLIWVVIDKGLNRISMPNYVCVNNGEIVDNCSCVFRGFEEMLRRCHDVHASCSQTGGVE